MAVRFEERPDHVDMWGMPVAERRRSPDGSAQTRLMALCHIIKDGVLVLDEHNHVIETNIAFINILDIGISPSSLRGTLLQAGPASYGHAYIKPDIAHKNMVEDMTRGRSSVDVRYSMCTGKNVSHDYCPITDNGLTIGHLWILREINDHQVSDPDNNTPYRVDEKAWRREFAATIAHEVRTPATSVAAFVSLLEDMDIDQGNGDQILHAIHRNAERLQHLSSDLVTLANLETGCEPPSDDNIDIAELLHIIAQPFCEKVHLDIMDGPRILGNPLLLRQAIETLIAIALAADDTAHSGEVTVHAHAKTSGWTIDIHGLAPESPTPEWLLSTQIPGEDSPLRRTAGLGLLLARAIATYHRGYINIHYDNGECHFVMRIPTH